ncbi:MAG: hypothetical protein J4F97_01660, partial [Pseudomonadales bacterium]|nr:hypothetical protein [Pseudomonadales bacterium]
RPRGLENSRRLGPEAIMFLARSCRSGCPVFALCKISLSVREVVRFAEHERVCQIQDSPEQALNLV